MNDKERRQVAAGSYAAVSRSWRTGDTVELSLPMTVRFVEADDREDVSVTAVPYVTWANRGPGPMRVWLYPMTRHTEANERTRLDDEVLT